MEFRAVASGKPTWKLHGRGRSRFKVGGCALRKSSPLPCPSLSLLRPAALCVCLCVYVCVCLCVCVCCIAQYDHYLPLICSTPDKPAITQGKKRRRFFGARRPAVTLWEKTTGSTLELRFLFYFRVLFKLRFPCLFENLALFILCSRF